MSSTDWKNKSYKKLKQIYFVYWISVQPQLLLGGHSFLLRLDPNAFNFTLKSYAYGNNRMRISVRGAFAGSDMFSCHLSLHAFHANLRRQ